MGPEHEVIAVRYATLESTRANSFYRYSIYGEPDAPMGIDYYFWVLRNGRETILVDTGFDKAAGERRGRTCLIEPLDALGIAREDVSRVVASHFHYDHIGNIGAFPNAVITAQEKELDFWLGPYATRRQFANVAERPEIEAVSSALKAGRVQVLDGDGEVAPGVVVRLVGGHCPGQQITIVDGTDRQVVIASDAMHLYEEMERDMPFAIFSDLEQTYRALDVLSDLERSGAVLVAGHDPAVMTRFSPLSSALGELAVRIS